MGAMGVLSMTETIVFVTSTAVEAELRELWLELRNDCSVSGIRSVTYCVRFARRLGLIDECGEELWVRRIATCPGHDDEGGRKWCAYCGDIA